MAAAEAHDDKLQELLKNRRAKAQELIVRCTELEENRLEGAHKLKKKLKAELKFLESLPNGSFPIKESQVSSSNLIHLEAVLNATELYGNVCGLFKVFTSADYGSVTVDVVSFGGNSWINVIARNAKALHRMLQGEGQFGERNLLQQAKIFLEASRENIINFSPPVVTFFFYNGVTESLAGALRNAGVQVQGEIWPDPERESCLLDKDRTVVNTALPAPYQEALGSVNLDVTTMLAYVSSLTNGGCDYLFKEDVLNHQAEEERAKPLLPRLQSFLQGRKLLACQSAVKDFKTIVNTLGGDKEKERTRAFLADVTVVEDSPSARSLELRNSSSVKQRSKVIFGTGDYLQAVTATANASFVRGAASQGVIFCVFIHESRALTELKERNEETETLKKLKKQSSP